MIFSILSTKKNLDANLINHLAATKHAKCVDNAMNHGLGGQAFVLNRG